MTPLERETIRELGKAAAKGHCPTPELRKNCQETIGDNESICANCHIFHARRVAEEKLNGRV